MPLDATTTSTRVLDPTQAGETACNICGGPAVYRRHVPASTVVCRACGLTSLARFPSPDESVTFYQEDYYIAGTGERFLVPFEKAVSFFCWLRARAILRRAPGPAALLDVGCGRGNLLLLFRDRGWRVLGTQLSRTAAEAARTVKGVDVVIGELPSLALSHGQFQVITFFHVLEHLRRPGEYLRVAHDLLGDGGLLLAEVPNCAGIGFRLLGERHFCFDHPHHLLFFTPASLRRLLEDSGFEVEEVSRFSLEYSPYGTLQSLLNALPGTPNRLYRSLQRNAAGRRLRKSPWTWLHALAAIPLAPVALLLSLAALVLPGGNTIRFWCRKNQAKA